MFQQITLIGHLGKDPEMRYTPAGVPITTFSIATSRKWTDNNGELKEETLWFRIVTFSKQAETCNQYLSKGKKVLVQGTLAGDTKTGGPRVYERKDGTAGASFEVRASTVRFLSPRGTDGAGRDDNGVEHVGDGSSLTEEELPF